MGRCDGVVCDFGACHAFDLGVGWFGVVLIVMGVVVVGFLLVGGETSRQRTADYLCACGLSGTSCLDRRLVCATELLAADFRGTRQYRQPHRGSRIGQRRFCNRTIAEWSGESAIEGSPVATRTASAWDRHRLSEKSSLQRNGRLYSRCQAGENGLMEFYRYLPRGVILRAATQIR